MPSEPIGDPLHQLEHGPLYWFADWPIAAVPRSGALVYTVWDRQGRFVYVGMAGRAGAAATGTGPYGRLASHASGRRSGDQFCVYVCDRLVLPTLHNRISEIGEGQLSLDRLTREFIRNEFGFRFAPAASGPEALSLEREIQRGALGAGKPFLNPLT